MCIDKRNEEETIGKVTKNNRARVREEKGQV